MTSSQKKVTLLLFSGKFARKVINAKGKPKYKIFDEKLNPLQMFNASTLDKQPLHGLLKTDKKGRITLNLSIVRQQNGNSFVKKHYDKLKKNEAI